MNDVPNHAPAAQPQLFSEEELALDFARRHSNHLRYVAAWGKWMIWDGRCWSADDTLYVQDLCRRASRAAVSQQVLRQSQAARIESLRTAHAIEHLARTDRRLAATADQWDADPWLLNTPGGIVDLRREASARIAWKITAASVSDSRETLVSRAPPLPNNQVFVVED